MLVIFSDIHLTDESTAINVNPEAFTKILQKEIELCTAKNEAKEISIILNGDIFDFVRTDYWLKINKSERPWNGSLDNKTAMNSNSAEMDIHYGRILDDIMLTGSGKAFISMLNSLCKKFSSKIPFRIIYIIGNHDRILNTSLNLKSKITGYLSSCNDSSVTFTNEYLNEPEYSVLCRHGHEWDSANYGYELFKYINNADDYIARFHRDIYKLQTIGEVITSELMSGIIWRVGKNISDKNFITSLKDLNNIRPVSDTFLWLYWYGVTVSSKNKKILLNAFRDSLREMLNTDLAKLWDNIKPELWLFKGDITDRFQQMLSLTEDLNFDSINKYVEIFKLFDKIFGSNRDEFSEGALREFNDKYIKKKDLQYIIYGHTHEAKQDYFSGNKDGNVKMYINSGTFLPYIQRTNDKKSFASAYQMTMIFIYRRDEDMDNKIPNKYPTMELWNGIKRKKYADPSKS